VKTNPFSNAKAPQNRAFTRVDALSLELGSRGPLPNARISGA